MWISSKSSFIFLIWLLKKNKYFFIQLSNLKIRTCLFFSYKVPPLSTQECLLKKGRISICSSVHFRLSSVFVCIFIILLFLLYLNILKTVEYFGCSFLMKAFLFIFKTVFFFFFYFSFFYFLI